MHNISKDNLCETPKSEIVNTHMYVPVLGSLSILKSYGLYLTVLRKQNRKKKSYHSFNPSYKQLSHKNNTILFLYKAKFIINCTLLQLKLM